MSCVVVCAECSVSYVSMSKMLGKYDNDKKLRLVELEARLYFFFL